MPEELARRGGYLRRADKTAAEEDAVLSLPSFEEACVSIGVVVNLLLTVEVLVVDL